MPGWGGRGGACLQPQAVRRWMLSLWPKGAGSGLEPYEGPGTVAPSPCGLGLPPNPRNQLPALYLMDLGCGMTGRGGDERGLICILNHQFYSL